jgi:hypothetical protein
MMGASNLITGTLSGGRLHSMKNFVKLNNYCFPEELNEELKKFVEFNYNHRYYESLNN